MESIALLISQLFPPHTITEKHATYITVVAYNYSEEKHGINSFINIGNYNGMCMFLHVYILINNYVSTSEAFSSFNC